MTASVLFLKSWGALIIAMASFLLAVVSLIKSSQAQKLQNKINQIELLIKQHELKKIDLEKADAERSCVDVSVIRDQNNWKLRIWNSGNTTVYNVYASIDGETGIILLNSNMPLDALRPNKSYEVQLIPSLGSANRFIVTTTWDNNKGIRQKKTQAASL